MHQQLQMAVEKDVAASNVQTAWMEPVALRALFLTAYAKLSRIVVILSSLLTHI